MLPITKHHWIGTIANTNILGSHSCDCSNDCLMLFITKHHPTGMITNTNMLGSCSYNCFNTSVYMITTMLGFTLRHHVMGNYKVQLSNVTAHCFDKFCKQSENTTSGIPTWVAHDVLPRWYSTTGGGQANETLYQHLTTNFLHVV